MFLFFGFNFALLLDFLDFLSISFLFVFFLLFFLMSRRKFYSSIVIDDDKLFFINFILIHHFLFLFESFFVDSEKQKVNILKKTPHTIREREGEKGR